MAYILDALVILIVIFCIWRGWKRGLIRTLVMLVGFVAAALIAGQLSPPLAGGIYDRVVGPRMEQSLVDKVVETGNTQVAIGLDSMFGDNAAFLRYFEELGLETSINLKFDDLSEEAVRATVEPAIEQVLRPAVVHIMAVALTVVLFVILLLVVFLLSRFLDVLFKLPVLKQLNQCGGLAAGVLQGVFWAMLFAVLVQFAANWGLFGSALTAQTVEQSWLTAKLADWNWIFIRKV